MSKKLVVIMICAGMSVGLAVGFFGTGTANSTGKVVAAQSPSSEEVTCTAPCSMDDLLLDISYSPELNGLNENHEYSKRKAELKDLKAELSKLEKGTEAYQEKLEQIHKAWGRLSIVIGELNSRIDIEREILLKISSEVDSYEFPSSSICGKIRYATEDLFE